MPPGKKQPTNTMLVALITFVGLFLLTTAIAVIYYLKAEEYRTKAVTLQNQTDELATQAELRKIGAIIGEKQRQKSRLGTMVDYLDEMTSLIIGGLPEDTSAEVKVNTAKRQAKETLEELLAQPRPEVKSIVPEVPTNEFVELLVNEQFATATESFDETMKDALPAEKLEEIWKTTTSQLGPFKKQLGVRREKQLDHDIVLVTCEFEKAPLDVKVIYDSEKQVAGLFFVPTPAEVLESYQTTPELPAQGPISIGIDDPNTIGLIRIIEKIKVAMDNLTTLTTSTQQQLEDLQKRFDDVTVANLEKEKILLEEKEQYQQQVNDIKNDYDDLKALMEQTSEQQVRTLMSQLDGERDNRKKLNQRLLRTEAELKMAEDRMRRAQQKLQALVPPPDSEVAAYKPDGKIILIDDAAKIAHLNIGSNDRVYRGLTFSVYDKNMPIPRDGKGKAEIEVFNVGKNISAARIISSDIRKPIILDDIVANLIWNSDKTNVFVVAGEFDLDGDGNLDYEAADRVKALIENWGGRTVDIVSIDTDFLVLGSSPRLLRKPTFEQIEVDPMATEKYEASLRTLANYQEVKKHAQALSIPIFNAERFLYFIGYKTQSSRAGAF
jgi:hypothetical protein